MSLKEELLENSKTFCMFPWLHLYVSPKGKVYPCCTTDQSDSLGDIRENTLEEIFNNDKTKELRYNMAKGIPSKICSMCYKAEETNSDSYRNYSKVLFKHRFDEVVENTMADGTVNEFKMRLIDVRFSNICNFGCRTCGSECSSFWAAEERKAGKIDWITIHADDNSGKLLDEVLGHVDHADMIYFAGGEPLITDEHYAILHEMIKRGKTSTPIKYNTNASTVSYKDNDLFDLWKHFDNIELACSIDHYGERAEIIRHGTDWGKVETNLINFRKLKNVNFSLSTVLSVFNYLTIHDFYRYMIEKDLVRPNDTAHYLSLTTNPKYFCATIIPPALKGPVTPDIHKFMDSIPEYELIRYQLDSAIKFANSTHNWEEQRYDFVRQIYLRDRLRGEDVMKVFPELTLMFDN